MIEVTGWIWVPLSLAILSALMFLIPGGDTLWKNKPVLVDYISAGVFALSVLSMVLFGVLS